MIETEVSYKVKILQRKGQSVLVEWDDGKVQRGYIPFSLINDDFISGKDLSLSIPYGIDWSKITLSEFTTYHLDNMLKEYGIWTKEDAYDNPQKIVNVLKELYQLQLSTVLKFAEEN